MIYKFKDGRHVYRGIKAEVIGRELERIRLKNNGRLAPSRVLEEAAQSKSPIHDAFTWDDKKAAHEFRLHEARTLIRGVVVFEEPDSKPKRAYWNVRATMIGNDFERHESYYQSAKVVAESQNEFEAALRVMLKELHAAERGLHELRQIAPKGGKMKVAEATGSVRKAQEKLVSLVD